jgi:hypothetical protein
MLKVRETKGFSAVEAEGRDGTRGTVEDFQTCAPAADRLGARRRTRGR